MPALKHTHLDNAPELPSDDDLRATAKADYEDRNLIIDTDADTSLCDDGAWVQAWVYVPYVSVPGYSDE